MRSQARRMQSSDGSDSAQVLSLSLFLMLLAFFIVLSTFSDFEEDKVSAVQTSVDQAFASASDIMGETGAPSDVAGDDFASQSGQAFDDIESVLKAQIGLISITRDAEGGLMTVSVPEKSVFEDHLSPYGGGKTLATEITSIIKRTEGTSIGFRVRVNGHLNKDTLAPMTKVKGLGIFARSMMQKGMNPHAMSIGLVNGKAGYVDLVFESYRGGDQAHLTLEETISPEPSSEAVTP